MLRMTKQYGNSVPCHHAPHTFVPVAVTSNLWIIPSNPKTLGSTITIICPAEATSMVPLEQPIQILRLSPACSATSRYFHLPPYYEDHTIMMNISLDAANINAINISTLDFRIWKHFNSDWTSVHLQKLANVPEVPAAQLYKNMINTGEPVHSFPIKDDDKDPSFIWTFLKHTRTYIGTIGMIFAVCVGIYCFKRFWIRPSSPKHQPYSPACLRHAVVDDDVEVAPMYRSRGMVEELRKTPQES